MTTESLSLKTTMFVTINGVKTATLLHLLTTRELWNSEFDPTHRPKTGATEGEEVS
jgi:hypothetical protein